jgi:hypothetical protein
MAKKKQEEAKSEEVVSNLEVNEVKSVSYKIDKVKEEDEFGRTVTKLKHFIFEFTINKNSDTILSSKVLVETSDAMEAMTMFQTAAGKMIMEQKNKEG